MWVESALFMLNSKNDDQSGGKEKCPSINVKEPLNNQRQHQKAKEDDV